MPACWSAAARPCDFAPMRLRCVPLSAPAGSLWAARQCRCSILVCCRDKPLINCQTLIICLEPAVAEYCIFCLQADFGQQGSPTAVRRSRGELASFPGQQTQLHGACVLAPAAAHEDCCSINQLLHQKELLFWASRLFDAVLPIHCYKVSGLVFWLANDIE